MHRWLEGSLQLQGLAFIAGAVRAAREVGEGDLLSSTYRRLLQLQG